MAQQRPVEFTSIDFDNAHNHWIQNKRKLSNGMYRYICVGFFKNGNQCNRNPLVGKNACKIHDFPTRIHEEPKPDPDEEQNRQEEQQQEDTYHRPIESLKKTKPQLKKTTKISTEIDITNINEIKIKQRVPITRFIKSLWKMYRTFPTGNPADNNLRNSFVVSPVIPRTPTILRISGVLHNTKMNGSKQESQDPIIDPYKETIRVQTEPLRYTKFEDLRKAFDRYGSIDKVRNPATIRKNRYNMLDVAYYLQMMLIFMEGLDEISTSLERGTSVRLGGLSVKDSASKDMTKLSTKHVCVMMMKTRLLMFVNYDTNTYLHTTESKWRVIRNNIRDEILYILDDIFDEIGE